MDVCGCLAGEEGNDERGVRELDDRKASRESERGQTLEITPSARLAWCWRPPRVARDVSRLVGWTSGCSARPRQPRPDNECSKHLTRKTAGPRNCFPGRSRRPARGGGGATLPH